MKTNMIYLTLEYFRTSTAELATRLGFLEAEIIDMECGYIPVPAYVAEFLRQKIGDGVSGRELRRTRKELELTHTELATKLRIPTAHLKRLEREPDTLISRPLEVLFRRVKPDGRRKPTASRNPVTVVRKRYRLARKAIGEQLGITANYVQEMECGYSHIPSHILKLLKEVTAT